MTAIELLLVILLTVLVLLAPIVLFICLSSDAQKINEELKIFNDFIKIVNQPRIKIINEKTVECARQVDYDELPQSKLQDGIVYIIRNVKTKSDLSDYNDYNEYMFRRGE